MADAATDEARCVLVVAGSGRSGTSTLAGVTNLLGLHVPEPVIATGRSNPKGFFEPQWVVELHQELLHKAVVVLDDARPGAFDLAARQGARPAVQRRVREWLHNQLTDHPQVVVKDPRNSWFLPMWEACAQAAESQPCFATMLRHPAEVVGSKDTYYVRSRFGSASKAANWLNVNLAAEHATRSSARVFVRYPDLLQDWRHQVHRVDNALTLQLAGNATKHQLRQVDDFVDPDLRRVQVTWRDLDVPAAVKDLCETAWEQLGRLAVSDDRDHAATSAALDQVAAEYARLYGEAESITQSSIVAARVRARRVRVSRDTTPEPALDPVSSAAARRPGGRGRR